MRPARSATFLFDTASGRSRRISSWPSFAPDGRHAAWPEEAPFGDPWCGTRTWTWRSRAWKALPPWSRRWSSTLRCRAATSATWRSPPRPSAWRSCRPTRCRCTSCPRAARSAARPRPTASGSPRPSSPTAACARCAACAGVGGPGRAVLPGFLELVDLAGGVASGRLPLEAVGHAGLASDLGGDFILLHEPMAPRVYSLHDARSGRRLRAFAGEPGWPVGDALLLTGGAVAVVENGGGSSRLRVAIDGQDDRLIELPAGLATLGGELPGGRLTVGLHGTATTETRNAMKRRGDTAIVALATGEIVRREAGLVPALRQGLGGRSSPAGRRRSWSRRPASSSGSTSTPASATSCSRRSRRAELRPGAARATGSSRRGRGPDASARSADERLGLETERGLERRAQACGVALHEDRRPHPAARHEVGRRRGARRGRSRRRTVGSRRCERARAPRPARASGRACRPWPANRPGPRAGSR